MSCFDNLIGLDGVCDQPTSGLTLNQIGISRDELDKIANKDLPNGEALFVQKRDFALEWLKNNLNRNFDDNYQVQSFVKSETIGERNDNKISKPAETGNYVGINIELCDLTDYYEIHFPNGELFVDFAGVVPVVIIDLIQGKILDTINITTVAGEITPFTIEKSYQALRNTLNLFIGYDSSFASFDTTVTGSNSSACKWRGWYNVGNRARALAKKLPTGGTLIDSNLDGLGHTGGLTVNCTINCDHEGWICDKRNALAMPMLYKIGEEVMKYKLYNSRRNNSVTDHEIAQTSANIERYADEASNALKQVLGSNLLPNTQCFKCRQVVKNVIVLP